MKHQIIQNFLNESVSPINSFKELIGDLKKYGFKNPVIRANLDGDIMISSMEDFKKTDYHTFTVDDRIISLDGSKHKKNCHQNTTK